MILKVKRVKPLACREASPSLQALFLYKKGLFAISSNLIVFLFLTGGFDMKHEVIINHDNHHDEDFEKNDDNVCEVIVFNEKCEDIKKKCNVQLIKINN